MTFTIRCVPPSVTAQQKRRNPITGHYFHGQRMVRETQTWDALLRPHVPAVPMLGPVELHIVMVYPHLKRTRLVESALLIPKVSKPDAGNASKMLEDLLSRMRFIGDDAAVSRLIVEKWH